MACCNVENPIEIRILYIISVVDCPEDMYPFVIAPRYDNPIVVTARLDVKAKLVVR